MGLLNRVKQLVGKGVQLEVEVPSKFMTPGGVVSYQLTLSSEEPLAVRAVTVELIHGSDAPGSANWGRGAVIDSAAPLTELSVVNGKPFHHAGVLRLPDDAPTTVNDPAAPSYWALRVQADIPNSPDPCVVVGFVVGPPLKFEWALERAEMRLGVPPAARQVSARGACTVVQAADAPIEGVQTLFQELLPQALGDLLQAHPEYMEDNVISPDEQRRIAGALREIINPLLRANEQVSLDSLLDLTVHDIAVE